MYDVIVIGAGVTGSAIARELSRYQLKLAVLEREEDVCCGTSKANSAIVHAGFDAMPGTMKAEMNVRGNQMMPQLAKDLDIPYKQNGSFVCCFSEDGLPALQKLYERGITNGVPELRLITGEEIFEMEPNLSREIVAVLDAPTAGIICPFKLTIALAENAYVNGAEFFFNTEVKEIAPIEGGWRITTNNETYETRTVVNAAGLYADVFNNMVSETKLHLTPRKGEYILMDKKAGNFVTRTIFQQPTALGKGILVAPTVHGNLLAGPTAENIEDKEETSTSAAGLAQLSAKARLSAAGVPLHLAITSFAGLRAVEDKEDFILGEPADAPGFYNAAGIDSPGLSSAPAIGQLIAGQIAEKLSLTEKENFIATRKDVPHVAEATPEELAALIAEDPAYGVIVCRCETVTEGEIRNAIRRPLGAKSLDGVKRRTRAGMGRCQAGFCSPRVMEILQDELGIDPLEITKAGGNSRLLVGKTKEA